LKPVVQWLQTVHVRHVCHMQHSARPKCSSPAANVHAGCCQH
jgi:hypothetical protein